LHNELGNKLCRSLPGYHAFTGCDYTASFSKRGKTRPFNVPRKHERFQEVFYTLGIVNEVAESSIKDIEEFVCLMYGQKKATDVNEVRLEIFLKKYSSKAISTIKKLDGNMLPPCSRSLLQKIKRTQLIAKRWLAATDATPTDESPESSGWVLDETDGFKILWFEGNATPDTIDMITTDLDDVEGMQQEFLVLKRLCVLILIHSLL